MNPIALKPGGSKLFLVSGLSLLVIGLPFFIFVVLKSLPGHVSGTTACVHVIQSYLCAESRPFLMLTKVAVLSSAAMFGSLGTTISVLSRKKEDEISARQLVGLHLIGAVFAVVLCMIFAGGFIQGSLFPRPITDSWFGVIYDHGEYAKLLVWSFIVGFSERALPQLLNSLSSRLTLDDEDKQSSNAELKPTSVTAEANAAGNAPTSQPHLPAAPLVDASSVQDPAPQRVEDAPHPRKRAGLISTLANLLAGFRRRTESR